MDADYNRNLDVSGQPARDFDQSLFVLTTVQSVTVRLHSHWPLSTVIICSYFQLLFSELK